MRDKYWSMYERFKFDCYYYWHYRNQATIINRIIMIFLLSASLASVAGLWFWTAIPIAWSIVAAIAQILSAIAFLFPQSEQISAINVFLPEMDLLLIKIDRDWAFIDDMKDKQINDLVYQYEKEYLHLCNRFIGSTPFPRRKACTKKANCDFEGFKFQRFDIRENEKLEEVIK